MRRRAGLLLLALAIAAQYAWNSWTVTPLTGFDAPGHAAYIYTILTEHRLPHPYQGWSTFHPPVYYLLGAGVWRALEPWGPQAVVAGLRAIGAIALLAAGAVTFALARRRSSDLVAATAAALLLLVPGVQMTGVMVRNEALAAGFAALAIPPILSLQRDPRRLPAAAAAGLWVALSIATKVTGIFLLPACALPFLRRRLDRRALRSALLLSGLVVLLAAPIAIRNFVLCGDPLPFNWNQPVVQVVEASQALRERRLLDYLWIDPRCLWRPSIHHVKGDPPPPPAPPRLNPAMTNVWGLTYASLWWDAFGHRIPPQFQRDGVAAGRLLVLLGLVPTGVMLWGFARASAEALRTRGRSDDAPLVAIAWTALAAYLAYTFTSPTIGALKATYMLPAVVPAALFYVRGVSGLRGPGRATVLGVSAAAALFSALVFTESLWFPPIAPEWMAGRWKLVGTALPGSHIGETIDALVLSR